MKISILVVSFNPGEAIVSTVNSILTQKNADYEIIVKDGGSTDGSLERLPQSDKIRMIVSKDRGIYDAMNQAAQYATGDYALYLNCGDTFPRNTVLEEVSAAIYAAGKTEDTIYYGDCYVANRNYTLHYPPVFDDYICLTMVLCHQATVYPTTLLKKRAFDVSYKIAADYELYVYAYKHQHQLVHLPVVIAYYEGDGASETTKNRRLALAERKRAMKAHFTKTDYRKVWWKAQFHAVGLKHLLVRSEFLYPLYKKLAKLYYKLK